MIATTLASNYEAQVQRKKSFLKPFFFFFWRVGISTKVLKFTVSQQRSCVQVLPSV